MVHREESGGRNDAEGGDHDSKSKSADLDIQEEVTNENLEDQG